MTTQQIDILCDEFEAALRQGDTVRIEDYLNRVEESQRNALLQELLEIKIQYAVDSQQSEDYVRSMIGSLNRQFPDKQQLIRSLVRQSTKLKQVGDYEILGELGRGGMGTVYKAKHKLLQQTVAVKVLSEALLDDAQAVGRFRREMQLIGGLTHPNIVRALNAGETDGVHYLAMEYVDGITLQKLVENVRAQSPLSPSGERVRVRGENSEGASPHPSPLPEGEGIKQSLPKGEGTRRSTLPKGEGASLPIIPLGAACEMIRQAALGLQNAHELKLVHRDIKPANLMLDSRGTVKLLDLGLGKFAEEHRQDYHSSLTMAGMVIGTVDYISPEQCENSGTADVRSDLYSLGCTLYFLLTGKPVYSGSRYDTMRKKLMGHIVGDVPSVRREIPTLPLAIEAILQKVLSKDPADRFQTPLEFAEAIAPFASPDELWTLTQEVIPMDAADTRSSMRHSSPYGYVQSSRQNIVPPPVSRTKWVLFFMILNLLIAAIGVGVAFHVQQRQQKLQQLEQLLAMQEVALEAIRNSHQLQAEWRIEEAKAEMQKVIRIKAEEYLQTRNPKVRAVLFRSQIGSAMLRWYHGEASGARRELQSILESVDRAISEDPSNTEFLSAKTSAQTRLADLTLFGGAASGLNRERFENRISLYDEAARHESKCLCCSPVRRKQAILLALHGDLEQAERLLDENPLPDRANVYATLPHQLAEAVLHYYQNVATPVIPAQAGIETEDVNAVSLDPRLRGGAGESGGARNHADRTRLLRTFHQQFALQTNPARGTAAQPEVIELMLFCAEFLLHDSIQHEDWRTLARDIASMRNDTANFLRSRPGALPFVRRFCELLVQSAVLVYENSTDQEVKQRQIENIVFILDRMRPLDGDHPALSGTPPREGNDSPPVEGRGWSSGMPTQIFFFLPEGTATRAEPGFVVFHPPEGRPGALYRLDLTRQMVKQPVPSRALPPLPAELLAQIEAERAAGRRIQVSWTDTAAWANPADALNEREYPYGDVLPLR